MVVSSRNYRMWVSAVLVVLVLGAVWACSCWREGKGERISKPDLKGLTVPANLNENTKSVAAAIQNGKNPERLSIMFVPPPFDPVAFKKNPQDYLNTVEPGRVYQTAKPGKNVTQLRAKDSLRVEMVAEGSAELAVVGVPGAPVTFTATDGGRFQNQLNSITVLGDEKGVASVTYTATRGTIDHVTVLAGSPMASDTVRFGVYVEWNQAQAKK